MEAEGLKRVILVFAGILLMLAAHNIYSQLYITYPMKQIINMLDDYETYAMIIKHPYDCCDGIFVNKYTHSVILRSTQLNKDEEAYMSANDGSVIKFAKVLDSEKADEMPNDKKAPCTGSEYYYIHRYNGNIIRKYLGCYYYEGNTYGRIINAFYVLADEKL